MTARKKKRSIVNNWKRWQLRLVDIAIGPFSKKQPLHGLSISPTIIDNNDGSYRWSLPFVDEADPIDRPKTIKAIKWLDEQMKALKPKLDEEFLDGIMYGSPGELKSAAEFYKDKPFTLESLTKSIGEYFYGKVKEPIKMHISGSFLAHCPEEDFKLYYTSEDITWGPCGKEAYDIIQDRIKRLINEPIKLPEEKPAGNCRSGRCQDRP
jgi:hypothetical protein